LGYFFKNLLVTLPTVYDVERSLIQLTPDKIRCSELLGNERIGVLAVGQRQEVRLKVEGRLRIIRAWNEVVNEEAARRQHRKLAF
jgi:hypothetical protein